jgi:hypothetical protein
MSSIKKAKEKKRGPGNFFALFISYSLLLRVFASLRLCVKKMNFAKRTHSKKYITRYLSMTNENSRAAPIPKANPL